ncbi:collagen-binding domain-containing protein [Massilia sp. METH4]|uniref:collagen-binding domain-containing protein n=1 Tax=Massilia sp. METH4 TaxID=3123041 RepID=UPI0030D38F44
MLRTSLAILLSAMSAAAAQAAPASAPLTATQVLNQMNAVSLTNVTASSSGHVHGRTWAAGTVSGGEYGNQLEKAPASAYAGLTAGSVTAAKDAWGNTNRVTVNRGGLVAQGSIDGVTVNEGTNVVGGNVANSTLNRASQVAGSVSNTTFNGGAIVGGSLGNSNVNGGAYVGGSAANSNINGGATIMGAVANTNANGGAFRGLTADFATPAAAATSTDFGAVLNGLSDSLSLLKSTGSTVDISGSKATFNAQADAGGVAVFDLTGIDETLFALNEFQFNLNGASTVIMNTDVTTAAIHANFLGGSAQGIGGRVVWNFYDATSVAINTQFGGAVLATDALVTNTRDIEGGLFARELNLQAQVHVQPFTGNVDMLSPVPEPSAVAMIMAGLAVFGVGGMRRRREERFRE